MLGASISRIVCLPRPKGRTVSDLERQCLGDAFGHHVGRSGAWSQAFEAAIADWALSERRRKHRGMRKLRGSRPLGFGRASPRLTTQGAAGATRAKSQPARRGDGGPPDMASRAGAHLTFKQLLEEHWSHSTQEEHRPKLAEKRARMTADHTICIE